MSLDTVAADFESLSSAAVTKLFNAVQLHHELARLKIRLAEAIRHRMLVEEERERASQPQGALEDELVKRAELAEADVKKMEEQLKKALDMSLAAIHDVSAGMREVNSKCNEAIAKLLTS